MARNAPPLATTSALMLRLWRDYVSGSWPWLIVAFVLMVIEGSTLGVLSWTLQPMFDRVFVGGEEDLLIWVGLAIMALFAIRAVTGVCQRVIMTRVAQVTSTTMQTDLLRHMMSLDSLYFQANPPGLLMERIQGDTTAVQNVWQQLIQGVGRDVVALISLFVVALGIDLVWTLVAVIGVPLLIAPAVVLQRYVRRKTGQARDLSASRATRLDEIFHGIAPIKLNGMEEYQLGRFESVVGRIVRARVRTSAGQGMLPALIDLVTGIGFFGVLVLGGSEILAGEKTVGQFMSFFTAMALAFQPMRRLGGLIGIFQIAAASLDRLYALFDTRPTIVTAPSPSPLPDGTPEIALNDLHFAYEPETPVLDGLSFTAPAGCTTALVGPSGSGKSTVFAMLTRLIEPQSGQVLIGGTDIRDLDLADLRARFSVVTQDALLFDETIRQNILLGRTDIDAERLRHAVEAAHISDFLDSLPNGLDSLAGPRGSNLSGGQRQRVAIARALIRDTPVLLLDEATSALDAQSELAIQAALDRLSQGRTTLVIAHRLSTVRRADKIVVMNRGRVAESGTHDELMARGGLYADLYRMQFDGDAA